MNYLIPMLILAFSCVVELSADDSAGAQIYQHCINCHGPDGMGGREGEYPRIAGLPKDYIERQLSNFKNRKRLNKPMIPIFKNWRFDEAAMSEVADHITAMAVDKARIPDYVPAIDILAQFDSAEQFTEVGEELFQDCVQCHGEDARGRADKESPPLVQQYPNYLRKQIGDFTSGRRSHEHAEKMFGELETDEVEALIGYITGLDGR